MSTAILKFPNPLDPNGGNFTSIAQAKAVYKQITKSRAGKKQIQFDSQGNIIN